MVTLQQVEELRAYANISFKEARSALEETNGDILEAIINLEKKGLIKQPKDGGYYSTKESTQEEPKDKSKYREESTSSFQGTVRKFGVFLNKLFDKGNSNLFEVTKGGSKVMSFPVTILVLLMIFTFWITIPLMILGLFFGYGYKFVGPDLGKESVNRAMDSASNVAKNIKKEFKGDDNDD
ncbi:MAG: DUF4342 domain-containing protein [Tissierellaceae bacterium]|nr:DUF4342 domain-containing protein [Tissierellaceae bacterium]